MDVHLRRLRYFQAVAEDLHVTRAAQRLRIAQPSLSKQIRELEAELGTDLFIREAKTIRLTPAGVALHESVGAVLSAWREAETAVADAAAAGRTTLRVGFVASAANEMTRDIIAAFARLRPGWRVAMTQAPWSDPTAGLASGAVDTALLRLPLPGYEQLIDSQPLLSEPRWIAMASAHPLARRDRVAFRELLDEPFIATPAASGAWRDYWLGAVHRDGRAATIGAEVNGPDEWLEAIANGQGISLTPEATARYYARPGLVYLPVDGVDPSIVAVCWRAGEKRTVIEDFVHCCLQIASLAASNPRSTDVREPGDLQGGGVVTRLPRDRARRRLGRLPAPVDRSSTPGQDGRHSSCGRGVARAPPRGRPRTSGR